jgi:uncharacterized protein (TIGR00730 family)
MSLGMKRICVFCGSSPGSNPAFTAIARRLGAMLAERGIGLVYGGGNVGLMSVIADAVLAGNGEVFGVIPSALVDRELAHHGVTRLDVVDTMHERKQRMHDLSDGFIAMPGGYGTLDELFEALTWAQLGMHKKPCGLLEVDGYFAPLIQFLDGAAASRLLRPEHRALLLADPDPARLLDAMATFRAPDVTKWIDRADS